MNLSNISDFTIDDLDDDEVDEIVFDHDGFNINQLENVKISASYDDEDFNEESKLIQDESIDECEEDFLGTTTKVGCRLAMICNGGAGSDEKKTTEGCEADLEHLRATTRLLRHAVELLAKMKPHGDDEKGRVDACREMYKALQLETRARMDDVVKSANENADPLFESNQIEINSLHKEISDLALKGALANNYPKRNEGTASIAKCLTGMPEGMKLYPSPF